MIPSNKSNLRFNININILQERNSYNVNKWQFVQLCFDQKCLTSEYVGMIFRKEKVSVGLSQTDRYTLFYSVLKISFPLKS